MSKFFRQAQKRLELLGITPATMISQVNQADAWSGSTTLSGINPIRLKSGDYFQIYKFSNMYYINNLDLHHYPFVYLDLPIALEFNDPGNTFEFGSLRFQPDYVRSGIGSSVEILGFEFMGWHMAEFRHVYNSHFSQPESTSRTQSSYSQLVFSTS